MLNTKKQGGSMKKVICAGLSFGLLIYCACDVFAGSYYCNFEEGTPAEITGGTRTATEDYPESFGDFFQWSSGEPIVLSLHGIGSHSELYLQFELAVIDSWDGNHQEYGPDYFNLTVDGNSILHILLGQDWSNENWWGAAQGADSYPDSYRIFNIVVPHYSSEVTIAWFANGDGWQGSQEGRIDESFAIDNILLSDAGNAPIPEPATMVLFGTGLASLAVARRRKKSADTQTEQFDA